MRLLRLITRSLPVSLPLAAMVLLSACSDATATTTKADLKSLSAEQQEAVRALVRDTLVNNPEILTEAATALQSRQATAMMKQVLSQAADLTAGPANAPVTVVEFFDYRCPYCHAAGDYVANLTKTRKDVRIVYKELPILSAESEEAARAAIAVNLQDKTKYPKFHHALMANKGELNMAVVERVAGAVGVDVARMRADMGRPEVEAHIRAAREQAQALGINGTPGFIINGRQVPGFSQKDIDAAIAEAAASAKG